MTTAYIGLGSNMGNSPEYLSKAVQMISEGQGLKIIAASPTYLTEPQGIKDQTWFHNQVIRLECTPTWSAQSLLNFLQGIEQKLGRVRSDDAKLQHGPRCIDLDLLLFGAENQQDPHCTIPHPRITQRAFVLIPLRDVASKDILPFKIEQCLKHIDYRLEGQNIFQE